MQSAPRFSRVVGDLPSVVPFVGPEAIERRTRQPFELRLGANESDFGVSPAARKALESAAALTPHYCDPENFELRQELAAIHGVAIENVLVASGIDDLLGLAVRVFGDPDASMVTTAGTYPTFDYHVSGFGCRLVQVPYDGFQPDLAALIRAAIDCDARILYLANPDNPTGYFHGLGSVSSFLDSLPGRTALIYDEAYLDFVPPAEAMPLAVDDWRIVRLRTFSKAHGMAGLRIGYAIAHQDVIGAFERVRLHFGVNLLAQQAALASLRDPQFVRGVVSAVAAGRDDYSALGSELGVTALPSSSNFVSFDMETASRARQTLEALQSRGVFVRSGRLSPVDRLVRVTVAQPSGRDRFARTFREVVSL